jgi:hypothetical protein
MRILYLQMAGRTPYLMTQLVVWGSGGLRVGYQTSQQGRPELSSRMYDGEYCQVHISLDISGADIHIFSKSGGDSTGDRAGIHQAVRDSLQLGTTGCGIEKRCILKGELLVWNSEVGRIKPFYKNSPSRPTSWTSDWNRWRLPHRRG